MRIEYTNGWYDGEVNSSGEWHGYGELHQGSATYKGNFSQGKYDGYGELFAQDGSKYYGHFINGVISGKGHYIQTDYDYEGDFARGQPDGQGMLKTRDFRYAGHFSYGKIEGYGEMYYTNGNYVKGFFKDGKPHGRCIVHTYDADITGEFFDGKMNGQVDITYRDGRRYSGQTEHGVYSGQGKLTMANGDVYDGAFYEGKPHGRGRLTMRGGEVIEGEFTYGVAPKVDSKPAVKVESATPTGVIGSGVSTSKTMSTHTKPDTAGLDTTSRFYAKMKKLAEDRAYVANYLPIHRAGFERAKAEVRAEGGNPYDFCSWGYMIGDWNGGHYSGEKTGSCPDGYGFWSGSNGSYHGYFSNGQRSGYGTENVNGQHYEGYYTSGHRDGFFEHQIDDLLYRLEFSCGCPVTSYVEVYRKNKDVERPVFRGSCLWQNGKYIYVEGTLYGTDCSYVGKWKNGKLDGEVKKYTSNTEYSTLVYEEGKLLYNLADLKEIRGQDYRYVGLLRDGKRHGYGECFYDDGGYYKGEWQSDSWYGKGFCRRPSGETYQGDFVEYRYNGKGEIKYTDGSAYVGDFSNWQYHGKGKLTAANGTVYEGDFYNGKKQGKGKLTTAEGTVYEGDFCEDKKHGKGMLRLANGERYTGGFCDDCYHGYGSIVYANGDTYEGDWDMGNWHGKCKIYWKSTGTRFEGTIDRHTTVTEGKITYSDGSSYQGTCIDFWQYHGKGKYTDIYGMVQDGTWNHGKKHGDFKLYSTKMADESACRYENDTLLYYTEYTINGTPFRGKFVYNYGMVGYGSVTFADGQTLYCGWIYGDKKIRGVEKLGTVAYYDGEWVGLHREGVGIYTDDGGFSHKSQFHKDKPARAKERMLHPLAFDKICAQDRGSVEWLTADANAGSRNSAFLLGVIYENGYFGINADLVTAFGWYKLAAEAGLALGQAALGRCYYDGVGCAIDYKAAFANLKSAEKAQAECDRMYLYLARCYRYGYGTKAWRDMAKYYYNKAHLTQAEKAERDSL